MKLEDMCLTIEQASKLMSISEFIKEENLTKLNISREVNIDKIIPCTFDELIDYLMKAKLKYGSKSNVKIDYRCDYGDDYLTIIYDEDETDEEFNNRVERLYDDYKYRYERENDKAYCIELEKLNAKYGLWK